MARVTDYAPPAEYIPLIERAVRISHTTAGPAARLRVDPQPPHTDPQLEHVARVRAALAAWRALSAWKRARWTLCALRHGDPNSPPTGARGASGSALYVREYVAQRITTPRQPVSPCSRRRANPAASPWDFTP